MYHERPQKVGKYEIVGELGRGGMGVVYRGHDPVIKREVALKVLRRRDLDPADAESVLERFKREAQAAGSLHHPNIVAIYEYGEDADAVFIAMECVPGRSLRDHLVAGYRPELKAFPEILDQLLDGLEFSHSRGVIHRDIKPGNLLISEMGTAKISDFGIARLEQSHLTLMGEVLGTPYYMAPEQFDGQTADERSDVYSAAVIVYEVLTGRRPFEGQGANLMRQILEAPPPLPSTLEPRLPKEMDRVLLKALAKRPEDRFRSARQFLEALHLAFDDKPFPTARLSDTGEHEITSPHLDGDNTPSGTHRLRATKVTALRRAIAAGSGSPEVTAEPQAPKAAVGTVRKKPSILFVDDEERVLNALRMLFHQTYDVTVATGGEEALQLAKTRPFHVIVSDQRMPGMLGVELLRELKLVAPNSVRMLLTGYSDLAAIVGSVNDGEVFRFVSKPWNQDDLQATVDEAVTIAIALEASPPPRAGARFDRRRRRARPRRRAARAGCARDVGRPVPCRPCEQSRRRVACAGGERDRGADCRSRVAAGRQHRALQAAQAGAPADARHRHHRRLGLGADHQPDQRGADLPLRQQADKPDLAPEPHRRSPGALLRVQAVAGDGEDPGRAPVGGRARIAARPVDPRQAEVDHDAAHFPRLSRCGAAAVSPTAAETPETAPPRARAVRRARSPR